VRPPSERTTANVTPRCGLNRLTQFLGCSEDVSSLIDRINILLWCGSKVSRAGVKQPGFSARLDEGPLRDCFRCFEPSMRSSGEARFLMESVEFMFCALRPKPCRLRYLTRPGLRAPSIDRLPIIYIYRRTERRIVRAWYVGWQNDEASFCGVHGAVVIALIEDSGGGGVLEWSGCANLGRHWAAEWSTWERRGIRAAGTTSCLC
jgi:hypothetical protein